MKPVGQHILSEKFQKLGTPSLLKLPLIRTKDGFLLVASFLLVANFILMLIYSYVVTQVALDLLHQLTFMKNSIFTLKFLLGIAIPQLAIILVYD